MSKCKNCYVKKWYARVVDYHIFNEDDCPYICNHSDEDDEDKGGKEE